MNTRARTHHDDSPPFFEFKDDEPAKTSRQQLLFSTSRGQYPTAIQGYTAYYSYYDYSYLTGGRDSIQRRSESVCRVSVGE